MGELDIKITRDDLVTLVTSCKKISDYMDDCFEAKIRFSGRFSDIGELSFLDEILDIMGLPADNTLETDFGNYVTEGKWPKWCFCRDSWYHNLSDMTPEDLVDDTLECISKITREEREMYEIAYSMSEEDKCNPENFEEW